MKEIKRTCSIISVVLFCTLITLLGCKKSNDNTPPLKKKYVWAVGNLDSTNYALIYFSADGGENWIRQGEGQAALKGAILNDVWAIDENTVWVVAAQNVILKTTDGGKNWFRVQPPTSDSNAALCSISIIGKTDIWISGNVVYHSADGGNNWTSIQSDVLTNKYLQGIHAVNSDIIYVVGSPIGLTRGFIARTQDGGQSWDSIVPKNGYNKYEWIGVTASDLQNIVVYGQLSHYLSSNDGGQSWKNDSIEGTGGTDGADINCLKMLDKNTWWGAFDYDGIFKTKDAGNNWVNQGSAPGPKGMWLFGIDFYNYELCVIVAEGSMPYTGKIIKTANGGLIWELKLETHAQMHKVSFIK